MILAAAAAPAPAEKQSGRNLLLLALGVVYGDIGTSPLYALRQSLNEYGAVNEAAVLGVLSLITWALMLVVTVKYVLVIMRADNRGEGGLLALTALALRAVPRSGRRHGWIVVAGMIGAALFYGDGIITPAISVLSAVEGLKVATPVFEPFVLPIALVLLVALFAVQRHGTGRVGSLFGPVMVVWFSVLALLGMHQIVQNPHVLLALNPLYALNVFVDSPARGFVVLGAVFLAVTGAEALYADMGHFGRVPLRTAWLYFVLPALLLNYFGQGALVLADPAALENPFYLMAPDWGLLPLVFLASAATIIASQAVISGAFSLTRQAIQLGYLPRLDIRHTSADEIGQVYVPRVNSLLLVGVVLLVLVFRTSDNLGAAYGIAVTGTMIVTTSLAFVYMRGVLRWSMAVALPVFGAFLFVDLVFLGANLLKIAEGGWFPIAIAMLGIIVMMTWRRGRAAMVMQRERDALPLSTFLDGVRPGRPARIPGTAVYLTARVDVVPGALLHTLKHFNSLHERVVLMTMRTEDVPRVPNDSRIEIQELGRGFFAVQLRWGFMEEPSVTRALALCRQNGLDFDLMRTSFFVGRERLRAAKTSTVGARWRQRLFIFTANNALNATEFFGIPPNRAIEIGGHIEI
jgi:KUP system potassium uptake protein